MKSKMTLILGSILGSTILSGGAYYVYNRYYSKNIPTSEENPQEESVPEETLTTLTDEDPQEESITEENLPTLSTVERSIDLSDEELNSEFLENILTKIKENNLITYIKWGILPNDNSIIELANQINEQILKNYQEYRAHPTDFIHGLLSSHCYITAKNGIKAEFANDHENAKYNEFLRDWYVYKVFQPLNSDDYYSALYINNKTHHAVLAHRGTDIPGSLKGQNQSLKADLIEILNRKIGVQQAASYVATKETVEFIKGKYSLSMTGHSLGAWLAELSLYFCRQDFACYDVKAVTFDSPGTINHIEDHCSNVKNNATKVAITEFNMVTYLSAPNIVNICNQHNGKVYRVFPKIIYPKSVQEKLSSESFAAFITNNKNYLSGLISVSGHSLNPILETFDSKSGKPENYEEMLDWPHIKYSPKNEYSTSLIKGIIDNIPYLASLPDPLKRAISTAINKVIPDSTAGSVTTLLIEFLCGNINLDQHFETYRHLDQQSYYNGYTIKTNVEPTDKFKFTYVGHYKLKPVDLKRDIISSGVKGTADWYLKKLARYGNDTIDKEFSNPLKDQLLSLKQQYTIEIDPGQFKEIIISKSLPIELLREQINYLIKIDQNIKDQLERVTLFGIKEYDNSDSLANYLSASITNFVKRDGVFEKIDNILQNNQYVILYAFPGTGKTSCALEYGKLEQTKGVITRCFMQILLKN